MDLSECSNDAGYRIDFDARITKIIFSRFVSINFKAKQRGAAAWSARRYAELLQGVEVKASTGPPAAPAHAVLIDQTRLLPRIKSS